VDPGIIIRPETPADIAAIRDVTDRAFAGHPYSEGTEATIVDALRSQHGLAISLVAERDGRILGHVAFSPASAADRSPGWYALGPLSVEPRVQGQGIGSRLVIEGLRRLRELSASGCILVGNTKYYARFGFVAAPGNAPPGVPSDHFMVLTLGSEPPQTLIGFHGAFGV